MVFHCEVCGSEITDLYHRRDPHYCGPCWVAGWEAVEDMTDPVTFRTVRFTLYGSSPRYATEPLAWCDESGWKVYSGDRTCWAKLDDPGHRCSARCITERPDDTDHPVWLIGPDLSAWAVLSQEYNADGPPAPYGHGTRMRLVTGGVS